MDSSDAADLDGHYYGWLGRKPVILAAITLLLAGCASAPQGAAALGYPITVELRENQCRYLIQDMWMSDAAMVESWFAALPAKPDQVDVVWGDDPDRQCVEMAQRAVERSGLTRIVVRQGSREDYPDLLRQPARPTVR